MIKKVIRFSLSEDKIENAIRDLKQYQKQFISKVNRLRERIAESLANEAEIRFSKSVVDDLLQSGSRTANVSVSVKNKGNISIVVASGEDAIWVEFGAGVYHNGSVGSSPHPSGSSLGFTIGGYGKGMGNRDTWGFYKDGELRLTHGTKATMPMYNAMKIVCEKISEIVREVFG